MDELPMHIQKAVSRYQPVETGGLTLYPIVVKDYDTFLISRSALEVMHQSLPVAMMRLPLLAALYQMDFTAVTRGKPATGLFARTLAILALAMRLGEGKTFEDLVGLFQVVVNPSSPESLQFIRFTDNNGEQKIITPAQYASLRKIIAAQNGVRLESDTANPDIVRAEKLKATSDKLSLDINIEDWITAVSTVTGAPEAEIDDWPILRFQRKSDSIQRLLNFVICGIGECSGTTWKNGNPCPHPFFNKQTSGSGILTAIGGTDADQKQSAPPAAAAAEIQNFAINTKRSVNTP